MRIVLALLLTCVTAGCRSLQPQAELDEAAQLVEQSHGILPAWFEQLAEPAAAEPTGKVEPLQALTCDQAVRWSLARHPHIRRKVAELYAARADLVQAHLLPNPVIQIALGSPIEGGGSPVMAGLIQEIAALWERPARIDSAEAQLRAHLLQLADTSHALIAQVTQHYVALYYGERRQQLSQQLEKHRRALLHVERARLDAGEGDEISYSRAQQLAAEARVTTLQHRQAAQQARRNLEESIGADLQRAHLTRQLAPPRTLPIAPGEEECVRRAIDQRLDVRAALARHSQEEALVRLTQWQRLPGVAGGVGYQRNFENREGIFPTLNLTPRLLDTGRAATAKAKALEQASAIDAVQLTRMALLEARNAQVSFSAALERLQILEEDALLPCRQRVQLVEALVAVGESAAQELLLERIELCKVERMHNDALLECHQRLAELERSTAQALPAETPESSAVENEVSS